jgi:Raf kinase inhibitor-like YbhB/YbcL family protein
MSTPRTITLTSSAFRDGQLLPRDCTADGRNDSPPLSWTEPPPGTQSFALLCEDPDAPGGTFIHWVLFNLPADRRDLGVAVPPDPDLPGGVRQGTNSLGHIGYSGPAPPPGPPHRYFFKLFALDCRLGLPAGVTRHQLQEAMRGHQLAEGWLTGLYGR